MLHPILAHVSNYASIKLHFNNLLCIHNEIILNYNFKYVCIQLQIYFFSNKNRRFSACQVEYCEDVLGCYKKINFEDVVAQDNFVNLFILKVGGK